jgi:hypothetical protein
MNTLTLLSRKRPPGLIEALGARSGCILESAKKIKPLSDIGLYGMLTGRVLLNRSLASFVPDDRF